MEGKAPVRSIINLSGRPIVIHFEASRLEMDDEEFFKFCQLNPALRIKRTTEGHINVTVQREKNRSGETEPLF